MSFVNPITKSVATKFSGVSSAITRSLGASAARSFSSTATTRDAAAPAGPLKKTALYDLHVEHGGKMVPFAGWSMPVQYSNMGALDSHLHTRKHASIFDVSHMLQMRFTGKDRVKFLESLVVGDIGDLPAGSGTLSLFTNEQGGIIDDTIITNQQSGDNGVIYVVSNAGRADVDLAHIRKHLEVFQKNGGEVELQVIDDHSLVALQGPDSAKVLGELAGGKDLKDMAFMTGRWMDVAGVKCHVARSGYTGEDGFELSIPSSDVVDLTRRLVGFKEVEFAGLGARDSLRLEAGLCLYGNDIDETTTPMEANLVWTVGKRRRQEGGFLGADIILPQIQAKGGNRRRVGLIVNGAPARAGSKILAEDGVTELGAITSGVPSPSLGKNVAMGYVKKGYQKSGTSLKVKVRSRVQDAQVVKMPFTPAKYHKI
ncbi:hypothetical protein H4219_005403 [Mycoemilia scoparia]|uniref:Aminomethyltransferase n=1 Tax=Mycoemilia scoparia TaxID=417184 RepID=A0A9W8DJX4_9FUNG|nr:hypothetical protein H4219_005403 [Mycoemilia scoparia]